MALHGSVPMIFSFHDAFGLTFVPGPFTSNTSSPILFISNKADNVTPLRSAIQNAKGFRDSVILVQDSYGVSFSAFVKILLSLLEIIFTVKIAHKSLCPFAMYSEGCTSILPEWNYAGRWYCLRS